MSKMDKAAYRARLFEFAEFLKNLPEHKFDHANWCAPDHTCNTSACVAGWAVINYTDVAKPYIEACYDLQKFLTLNGVEYRTAKDGSVRIINNPISSEIREKYFELDLKVEEETLSYKDWFNEGQKVLGIYRSTAINLFQPNAGFWQNSCIYRVTNYQVGVTVEYIACTSDLRLRRDRYDLQAMLKFINENKSKYVS